jgi:nucleotide-binding universal stress UspA family protein
LYTIKVASGMTDVASIGALICAEADKAQAAMVVMVRHTKGAVQEFFLGSATSYCTHHSKIPMVILPEA